MEDNVLHDEKAAVGRKTAYTPELATEIIRDLCKGIPLAEICRREHMPETRSVNRWTHEFPDFASDFARARAEGFDAIAADCLRIMDDASRDLVDDGKGGVMINSAAVARARLQVEGRLKLLAKWDPKRYGDRIAVEEQVSLKTLTREEAFAQLKAAGLSTADIFGALTKPVQPIELEAIENTSQATNDEEFIDIPD